VARYKGCGDCRFFQPRGATGQCRYYPPVVVALSSRTGEVQDSKPVTQFPYVDPSQDWCGKYTPKLLWEQNGE
jgi:hypothetical protein